MPNRLAILGMTLHQPMRLGTCLSLAGMAVLAAGIAVSRPEVAEATALFAVGEAYTNASLYFKIAGWLSTSGWLLQRRQADLWPFTVPFVKRVTEKILDPLLTITVCLLILLSLYLLFVLSCFRVIVLSWDALF